jgi:hypothetical protein
MTAFDNYMLMTVYMLLAGTQECQFTVSKLVPQQYASLPYDVVGDQVLWATDIVSGTGTYAPSRLINRLRSVLNQADSITGVRFFWYAQGSDMPIVYHQSLVLAGTENPIPTHVLPTFMAASYYAPAFRYRQRGTSLRVPVRQEAYVAGNLLTGSFAPNGTMGILSGPAEGFVEMLTDPAAWVGPDSNRAYITGVVERVPNTPPEGSGVGTRLPTFPVDAVYAWECGPYSLNPVATTQRSRKPRD